MAGTSPAMHRSDIVFAVRRITAPGTLFVGASRLALEAHGDAHAAADAQCRKALLGVALLHLEQEGGQDSRAGRADRVADGDGAAIDVDLAGVPAEVLVDRA